MLASVVKLRCLFLLVFGGVFTSLKLTGLLLVVAPLLHIYEGQETQSIPSALQGHLLVRQRDVLLQLQQRSWCLLVRVFLYSGGLMGEHSFNGLGMVLLMRSEYVFNSGRGGGVRSLFYFEGVLCSSC